MSDGTVYAVVRDALSKIDVEDTASVNVAALLTDVGVDCYLEGKAQMRDDVLEILLDAGVDAYILNKINNIGAGT